ncbi:MAG TPA: hypothetical protein VLH85_05820 [Levilinea sp.]|nr:hypothetical protein [Levilinea sp.]
MNGQISPKDWQLLSEYLDGQLNQRDQTRLEQQMKSYPELQHGLAELRKLRAVLRMVPRRKVPHNFTLTRAMVEKPVISRWAGWVPALSLSSALATLLLVISMMFHWPTGAPVAMLNQQEEHARMMAAQPESNEMMQEVEMAPPSIIWGGPGGDVEGRGGMGGGVDPTLGMAAPAAEMAIEEDIPPEERAVEAPEPEPAVIAAAPKALLDANVEPLVGTGPILGIAPVEEQGAMQVMNIPAEDALFTAEQQALRPVSGWLILQISLGLMAAGAGISAFYLKRKAKA